ncbi:MAG: hypothetical protein GAK35_03934 [Herbaspirillum frisingense]|uniref:LysR substrate-binding domain-containing protein n=1 Tax=Herbaspirillum frisingense TaxID=92645 RepID=A0A7V8JSS6_9BURK|nr:MAG: hypothetical protein GAK35_03934 [Herbaspirillum frisingense]
MVANTLEPLLWFVESGLDIACLPDIAVRRQLDAQALASLLEEFNTDATIVQVLWPSSKQLSSKLRLFIDYIAEHIDLVQGNRL